MQSLTLEPIRWVFSPQCILGEWHKQFCPRSEGDLVRFGKPTLQVAEAVERSTEHNWVASECSFSEIMLSNYMKIILDLFSRSPFTHGADVQMRSGGGKRWSSL